MWQIASNIIATKSVFKVHVYDTVQLRGLKLYKYDLRQLTVAASHILSVLSSDADTRYLES